MIRTHPNPNNAASRLISIDNNAIMTPETAQAPRA